MVQGLTNPYNVNRPIPTIDNRYKIFAAQFNRTGERSKRFLQATAGICRRRCSG